MTNRSNRNSKSHNVEGNYWDRLMVILLIFCALTFIGIGRLFYLQVIAAPEYQAKAEQSRTISYEISPRRGTIYDRNGVVLASSVDATTVYVNPKEVKDIPGTVDVLCDVLKGEPEYYLDVLTRDTTFAYVQRRVDVDVAQRLKDKKLPGLYFIADSKRVYPNGSIGAQVVGLVDVDGKGITGLELYYDDILSGTPGKVVKQIGQGGIPLPGATETNVPAQDGQDIVISIDVGMQEYVEQRLAEGVSTIEGSDGSVVLVDAASGEIFACASTPYVNPNDLNKIEEGATQLKGITNAFEPGSIFKAVTALAALETHTITPDTIVSCPSSIEADEYYVSDAHERDDMDMSFRTIINESSNVGVSLIAEEKIGFKNLYSRIVDLGLNDITGVDYPGEAGGYLANQASWSKIQSYNVTFGQGIAVTPLQMTYFYGALRNQGVAITPHFLIAKPQTGETIEYESKQVITDQQAIDTLTDMLTTVVSDGTGKNAAIDGFSVAGKTGTAEVASETGGYKEGVYNLDFIGYIPYSTSSLVCFTGVNEVPYERQTTEVFHDIMSYAVERYKIAPVN